MFFDFSMLESLWRCRAIGCNRRGAFLPAIAPELAELAEICKFFGYSHTLRSSLLVTEP